MSLCLPINDPQPQDRTAELNAIAAEYEWDYALGVPHIKNLPPREQFTPWYSLDGALLLIRSKIAELAALPHVLSHRICLESDYRDIFNEMRPPTILEAFDEDLKNGNTHATDAMFAEQRVAGCNPMVLRLVDDAGIPPDFAVSDQHLRQALGNDALSLRRAIGERRLFVADFSTLPQMKGGRWWLWRKHLPRPWALFHWESKNTRSSGQLRPVAVQITPTPDPKAAVVTPADEPVRWKIARLCVQVADANHHEMCTHLGRTHLVLGRFAIATERCLSPRHPLGALLRPHFKYLLALIDLGKRSLLGPGAYTDTLLAGSLEESKMLLLQAYSEWDVFESALPRNLERRGLENQDPHTAPLPAFPYRDDGLLVWKAIERYVETAIDGIYGRDEQDIANDSELQQWAYEIAVHGRLVSMPAPLHDRRQLQAIITNLIFTSGPQHSAINYPQYDYAAFAPNMPLALYGSPLFDHQPTENDYLRLLPPRMQAMKQMEIMTILAGSRLDRLAYFSPGFTDSILTECLHRFRRDLLEVEAQIEIHNLDRRYPYVHMMPSRITNSTSA